jgi:hypothetical protein
VRVCQDPRIEELGMRPGRSSQRKELKHVASFAQCMCHPSQRHEMLLVMMKEEVVCCGAGSRIRSRRVWWHCCRRYRSWEG